MEDISKIYVATFEQKEAYDYEVDIKASDVEPAAAETYEKYLACITTPGILQGTNLKINVRSSQSNAPYTLNCSVENGGIIKTNSIVYYIRNIEEILLAFPTSSSFTGTIKNITNNENIQIRIDSDGYITFLNDDLPSKYTVDNYTIEISKYPYTTSISVGCQNKLKTSTIIDSYFDQYFSGTIKLSGDNQDVVRGVFGNFEKIDYAHNDQYKNYKIRIKKIFDPNSGTYIPFNYDIIENQTISIQIVTNSTAPFTYGYENIDIDDSGIIYFKSGISSLNISEPDSTLGIIYNVKRMASEYQSGSYSWWTDLGFEQGDIIKKGTILKITNNSIPNESKASYPWLPAYLIAKKDYEITGNGPIDYNNIGLPADWNNEDIAEYGRINTTYTWSDEGSIWESVVPSNIYANDVQWLFVTQGIVIDYISFQWNDKYNEPGTFNLTIVSSEENMQLFKKDRYLLISESDRVMMIESVVYNANLKSDGYIMQISGRSIEGILDRRIIFPGQGLNTNEYKGVDGLSKALYDLVDGFFMHPENVAMLSSDGQKQFYYPERKIDFFKLPSEEEKQELLSKRPFHSSINTTVSKDTVLKVVQDQCKRANLGFKIIPELRYGSNKSIEWKFCLYVGNDRSYNRQNKDAPLLLFSPKLGNVEAISTTEDISNYKNVAFCGTERSSDGFIDLTKTVSSANYWGQKTGVEIVDKFDMNATKLITGVKNSLVTLLEASPVCYTGILFLAIAASRKDCQYIPTVTNITSGKIPKFTIINIEGTDDDLPNRTITLDNPGYIVAYRDYDESTVKEESGLDDSAQYKMMLKFIFMKRGGNTNVDYSDDINAANKYVDFYVAPLDGNLIERVYFPWQMHHEVFNDNYWVACDIEYFYINNIPYGRLKPINYRTGYDDTVEIYGYPSDDEIAKIGYMSVYNNDAGSADDLTSIASYPTEYISKEDAEHIEITCRVSYTGDDGEQTFTAQTITFKLSDVNPNVVENENDIDFKTSTQFGWLTRPILQQAISDLNNTSFSRLSILKKSAIQLWFKTFDKYTSNVSQMRWLCQEYSNEEGQVGINRREVFVEEDTSDSDDWNAAKINEWQNTTRTISLDSEEDEESDYEVNKRLLETARKRIGDYRRDRNVEASITTYDYDYDSTGKDLSPNKYSLGDIIQLDDGWGNLETCIISGVTISNDIVSGPKTVPLFDIYEAIPKQYKRLEWLQVANMILPNKFNPILSSGSKTSQNELDPYNYSGAMSVDKNKMVNQGFELGKVNRINSEIIFNMTDIEADLRYITKSYIPSGDDNDVEPELQNSFGLISAIGYRSGMGDDGHLKMPFVILSSKYKTPFLFMSSSNNYYENDRYIYHYIDNELFLSDPDYGTRSRYHGCGFVNRYPGSEIKDSEHSVDDSLLANYYIYRSADDGQKHTYVINKPIVGNSEYSKYISTSGTRRYDISTIDHKIMYYSNSYVDENIVSHRPLSEFYYNGIYTDKEDQDEEKSFLINSGCLISENQMDLYGLYGTDHTIFDKIDDDLLPSDRNFLEKSYWGQDNYRFNTSDSYFGSPNYEYENNIVIGGIGYYGYDFDYYDYRIFFDSDSSEGVGHSPKGCDYTNGVRIYGLKIYETLSAYREIDYSRNSDITVIDIDSGKSNGFNYYINAYYPDLNTRILAHEYVPVMYADAPESEDNVKKYGLYDIIDQIFVPINYGYNDKAVFVEAGGEITTND